MANRTELTVDDLLNNFNAEGSTKKSNKDNKKAKKGNDWGNDDEEDYSFGLGKDTQTNIKTTKTTKKKVAAKGWDELVAETTPKTEEPVPEVVEEAKPEEPKKKGIMNLKKFAGGEAQTAAAASINVEEEYFPTLGEEAKPQPKKKTQPVNTSPVADNTAQQSAGGPRRFVNANKKAAGETFAPLNPELAEKPVPEIKPVVSERPVFTNSAGIQRGGEGFRRADPTAQQTAPTTATTDDSKIKFGGEGPRKFVGGANKISFKREEEKSEQELLREAREREIEEKLAKEREEQAKLREERDKRRAAKEEGHKPEATSEATQEATTSAPSDEKKPRFFNAKKDTSKPSNIQAAPAEKVEKEKPKTEEAAAPAEEQKGHAEKVEMNGTLSNKGWGEGPIKKTATVKK